MIQIIGSPVSPYVKKALGLRDLAVVDFRIEQAFFRFEGAG